MKKNILLSIIFVMFAQSINAQTVNTGFTYQGELIESGAPVNGEYDFQIDAYTVENGGTGFLFPADFLNVNVSNGLFSLTNVDFGDILYLLNSDLWLEISVRKSAVGGNYTILSPRQKIDSVPYAIKSEESNTAITASKLSTSGNTNDVLVHNGNDWVSGGNKIRVSSIGVSVGTSGVPPSDGLRVGGESKFDDDMSQDIDSTGLPKYLVTVSCEQNSNSISGRDLSNTGGNFSVESTGTVGYCRVNFPAPVLGKYWFASSKDNDGGSTSCFQSTNTSQLLCQRVDRNGAYQYGDFMIVVY